jgi:hypothetical protein
MLSMQEHSIPAKYKVTCELGQHDLDVRDHGIYQYTQGWVLQRDGGGGHGVSLPERAHRYACRPCVEKAVRGTLNQTAMFDVR